MYTKMYVVYNKNRVIYTFYLWNIIAQLLSKIFTRNHFKIIRVEDWNEAVIEVNAQTRLLILIYPESIVS